MHNNALEDARTTLASLPIYAQGLAGRDNRVKVVFSSNTRTARTDGEMIHLPALPLPSHEDDIEPARKLAALVYGFIPHEVGHVRHTDFSQFEKARGQLPIVKGLLNGIEDPRQEVELINEYPGVARHLDDLCTEMIGEGGFYQQLTEQDDPAWLLTAYSMYVLRGLLRGQVSFTKLADASREAVAAVLGEGFMTRLDVLLHVDGPKMQSTADAMTLTGRIVKALKEEAEPPPQDEEQSSDQGQEQSPDDGESSQTGDASQAPCENDDRGHAEGQEDASGNDGDDGDDQPGDGKQDPSGSNNAGAGGQDNRSPPTTTDSQRKALNQALQAEADQTLQDFGDQLAKAIEETKDQIQHTDGEVEDAQETINQAIHHPDGVAPLTGGQFDRDASLQQSGRLRALLRNELQAMQMERIHETTRGATFNQKRAFRTTQGDRRLFLQQDDRPGLNTAVFLLVDISSSMRGEPLKLASEALYATATALNGMSGVACAIGTFPHYATVLRFGERACMHEDRFGLQATGSTPLAEGLLWSSRRLVHRNEDRKILMVVTDGQPDDAASAKAQIRALEHAGIETMGLGIKLDSVRDLFDKSAVIDKIEQISPAMLEMLGNTLRRQLLAA